MKKLISLLLIAATLLSSFSLLSSCSRDNDTSLSRASWITALAEQFGLNEYSEKNSYFKDVSENESFYESLQSCVEWGVLDTTDQKFHPNDTARIDFALETALKAAGAELNGSSPVDYAVANNIIDGSGYLDAKGKLTSDSADRILDWCTNIYVNAAFEERENVVLNPEIKSLETLDNKIVALSENKYQIDKTEQLSVGDVVTLPGDEMNPYGIAKKIVKVDYDGDAVIIETEDPELEDICEEMDLAKTIVPTADNVILEEGVSYSDDIQNMSLSDSGYSINSLGVSDSKLQAKQVADNKGLNLSFKINFIKGKVSLDGSWPTLSGIGENIKVSGERAYSIKSGLNPDAGKFFKDKSSIIPDKKFFGKDPYDNTKDIDNYKNGKISLDELKKKLKLTKDQIEKNPSCMTNKFKGGYEITGSLSVKNLYVQPEIVLKKTLGIPTGIKSFSLTVNYEVESSLKLKGKLEDELTVCTMPIPSGVPGVTVNISLILFADFNGELSVKATLKNTTKAEYAGGKTKKSSSKTSNLSAELLASLDMGPGIKVGIYILGVNIVDADLKCAIRFKASAGISYTTSFKDTDKELTITRKTVFNAGADGYIPIISLSIGSKKSLANKVGLSFKWELVGEKNAYKFNIFKKEIVIWEEEQTFTKKNKTTNTTAATTKVPDTTSAVTSEVTSAVTSEVTSVVTSEVTSAVTSDDISTGISDITSDETFSGIIPEDYLTISTYLIYLDVGDMTALEITNIPKGYLASDLIWNSDNTAIASVNNGMVTAVSSGSASVTVKTSDGMYEAFCTIIVSENEKIEFTPLNVIGA